MGRRCDQNGRPTPQSSSSLACAGRAKGDAAGAHQRVGAYEEPEPGGRRDDDGGPDRGAERLGGGRRIRPRHARRHHLAGLRDERSKTPWMWQGGMMAGAGMAAVAHLVKHERGA